MRDLNKAHIGLGKVRNKIAPSIEEFSSLERKVQELIQTNIIQGTLSTLHTTNSNVSYIAGENKMVINLNSIKIVQILMNEDNKTIELSGGLEGKPLFFEISNPAAFNLSWSNLRVQEGDNPGLSINTTGGEPSKTIIEVVKLGSFYYMIGIYRDTPDYTLADLVAELNLTFDADLTRIKGYLGVITERFSVQDVNLPTISLGTITLSDNIDYVLSGYDFILEIPQSIMDTFYPTFIIPIIEKLETDRTRYYIRII